MTEKERNTGIREVLMRGKKAFNETESAGLISSMSKSGYQPNVTERRSFLDDIDCAFVDLIETLASLSPALDKTDIYVCIMSGLGLSASATGCVLALSGEAVRTRKFRMKNKMRQQEYRLFFGSERFGMLRILFMKDALQNFFRRFLVASTYLVGLAILLLFLIWRKGSIPDETDSWVMVLTLAAGVLLNVALRLWTEDLPPTAYRRMTVIVSNLLLAGNAAVLLLLNSDCFTHALSIGYLSVAVALFVVCLFLPFAKDKDDVPVWNFTWRTLFWAGVSFSVCSALTAGLMILIYSLDPLFGISPDGRSYYTVAVLTLLVLPLVLFLGRMPQGEEKHADTLIVSQFLVFAVRYLLTPLMGMYMLVLYAYGLEILIRWELPDGGVAILVTILMAGCILTEICLYPLLRSGGAKPFEKKVVRLLPAMILPLLVLATVGTIKRLSDYGLSVNRMYLVILLAWFYMVCAGLIAGGGKRIRWIAISFAVMFLSVSILPVNNSTIVRNYMKRRIEGYMEMYPVGSLPLDQDSYNDWIQTIPDDDAVADIMSKSLYLRKNFRTTTYDLFGRDPIYFPESRDSFEGSLTISHIGLNEESLEICKWVDSIRFLSVHEERVKLERGVFLVPLDGISDTLKVVLEEIKEDNLKSIAIKCVTSDRLFFPNSIYVHPNRLSEGEKTVSFTVRLDGILITDNGNK